MPRIEKDRAFIPVESSVGNAEGLLCLYRMPGSALPSRTARSSRPGPQLGIAADNITALDSIVRNNANMHAIFEGITEPLLLVDESGNPVVVNEAARRLGLDLSEAWSRTATSSACSARTSAGTATATSPSPSTSTRSSPARYPCPTAAPSP